ncbi:MAG: Mu transposase C-terminal domain-containing protein [Candidatus Gastranaerophilaceae bacterium]
MAVQSIDQYSYLSIKVVAEMTGVNLRKLQRYCKSNKYSCRKVAAGGGKNGEKYEILVASLEPTLQAQVLSNSKQVIPLIQENQAYSPALTTNIQLKVIPDSAKEIALAKFNIVDSWKNFRADKKDKKAADKQFLLLYPASYKKEYKLLGDISIGTLYRWKKILDDNKNNYYSLVNNYNYTGESQLNTSLTDEEKQAFIKLYYNDAQFNLGTAYDILKYQAGKEGKSIKSEATYRRFAKYIERNHYDFDVLARQGEKALKDKVVPSIRRNDEILKVGDILVADGNKLDFMIINPFTGKPARATMVVFMDWASRDYLGYEIMFSENTQCISSALRNAIIRLGKMPKVVYMDNGRAFKGKYFTGTDSFDSFKGIYAQLGIKLTFAKPYNGKAKIVERTFGDFVKSCPPAVSSYIGSSISMQPAHIKRNEKFHKELHKNDKIPTLEQAKLIIAEWLNFYRSKELDNGKTINEVFEEGKGTGVNIDMLDELMMKSEVRNVRRNTIKFFGYEYTSNDLYGIKDKVYIKYSLFDISKIKVYSRKGEYICEAATVIKYNPMAKYFGNATDIYSLKQAQKIQNSLINKTVKDTKAVMGNTSFENLPWGKIPDVIEAEETTGTKKKYEITGYTNAHRYLPEKKRYTI